MVFRVICCAEGIERDAHGPEYLIEVLMVYSHQFFWGYFQFFCVHNYRRSMSI